MWDLIWLLIGLVAGFFIGGKVGMGSTSAQIKELARLVSYHRSGQLKILQRELANILIRCNASRFLEIYEKAYKESEAFKTAEQSILKAQLLLLTNKYPQYEDFDLLGTRDYVLYSDAATTYSSDEIEQRYHDILSFQALQINLDKSWPRFAALSGNEFEHLKEYAREVIDSKFKAKLKRAVAEIDTLKAHDLNVFDLETPEFCAKEVSHYAENRYCIHFKSTNEYGLYGLFFAIDGKIFESYYRSDAEFIKEEVLHSGLKLDD